MMKTKREPRGERCTPIRLSNGTYHVQMRRGDRPHRDGEYFGTGRFTVERRPEGDIVRARPVVEEDEIVTGPPIRPPRRVEGTYVESVYNVTLGQYLWNAPLVAGDYITTEPYDLAAFIDPNTGTLLPDPNPGTAWYVSAIPSQAPYCLVSSLTNPATLYATYPFDGINGPYDYEYVVYDLVGLLYLV